MKLVLDTCILYPTVMREMLLGVAGQGLFEPIWSPQILGEWHHTAAKRGPVEGMHAESEMARANAAFPNALIHVPDDAMRRFWLPDAGDIHVLAAAVLSHSDGILTVNAKDFPRHLLAEENLTRLDPDTFLTQAYGANPEIVGAVADGVLETANTLSEETWTHRSLMKKARLPRLGKALG